jgi:predicted nucleotidyltransferase
LPPAKAFSGTAGSIERDTLPASGGDGRVVTTYGHFDVPEAELVELCRRHQVRELCLFGSALGDAYSADSDVDLLVEFVPGTRVGFLRLAALQRELSDLIGRRIDLVLKSGLKQALRDSVLSSAHPLYAA